MDVRSRRWQRNETCEISTLAIKGPIQATSGKDLSGIDVRLSPPSDPNRYFYNRPPPFLMGTKLPHLLALMLISLSLIQCRPETSQPPAMPPSGDRSLGSDGRFTLLGSYGTLAYEGSAILTQEQDKWVIRIPSLRLTFVPKAFTNPTPRIDVSKVRLVATKRPPSGSGPFDFLASAEQRVSVSLTTESSTATLTPIELSLPSDAVAKADHLGLAISDGKMLWPTGPNFKQPNMAEH